MYSLLISRFPSSSREGEDVDCGFSILEYRPGPSAFYPSNEARGMDFQSRFINRFAKVGYSITLRDVRIEAGVARFDEEVPEGHSDGCLKGKKK